MAENNRAEWLLLLDQDTVLTAHYFADTRSHSERVWNGFIDRCNCASHPCPRKACRADLVLYRHSPQDEDLLAWARREAYYYDQLCVSCDGLRSFDRSVYFLGSIHCTTLIIGFIVKFTGTRKM